MSESSGQNDLRCRRGDIPNVSGLVLLTNCNNGKSYGLHCLKTPKSQTVQESFLLQAVFTSVATRYRHKLEGQANQNIVAEKWGK